MQTNDAWDRFVASKLGRRPVHKPGVWSWEAHEWFQQYTKLLLVMTK